MYSWNYVKNVLFNKNISQHFILWRPKIIFKQLTPVAETVFRKL